MIAIGGLTGQRYAVLGLGRSGLAVARALAAGGVDIVVWDDNAGALRCLFDRSGGQSSRGHGLD